MSSGPIEELTVPFDATIARERVARRRRLVRSRIFSLLITVAILVAIYLWRGDQLSGATFFTLYAVVLAVSVGWFLVYLVGYLQAKRVLAGVGSGIAVRIGRAGVELDGTFVPWPEVVSLVAVKGGLGRGPLLRLSRTSGEPLSVSFEQIDVRPATLDMTARAYSAGRHGVDLEALDS
jgi:hypothetical protein